jgi:hypothetical protein
MSLDSVRGGGDYHLMPSPIDALPPRPTIFKVSEDDSPTEINSNRVTMEIAQEDPFPLTSRALLTPRGTSRLDLGDPPSPESAETPDLDLPCCYGDCLSSFKESVVKKVKAFAAKWCCCCVSASAKAQSPKREELPSPATPKGNPKKESRYLFKIDQRYVENGNEYHSEESSAQPNAKLPSFRIKYTVPLALNGAPSAGTD